MATKQSTQALLINSLRVTYALEVVAVAGKSDVLHGLGAVFPNDQIANVERWNRDRGWGFTDHEIDVAATKITSLPSPDPLRVRLPILVPYLESVGKTFEELVGIMANPHSPVQRDEELTSEAEGLRLLPGVVHSRGLIWEVIGLQSNRGEAPATCQGENSAHGGVLAAACHLPGWVQQLGSRDVPEVALAGYQIRWGLGDTEEWTEEWNKVPWLHRSGFRRRHLCLDFILATPPNPYGLASPEVFQRVR
jgi:hypothetical protein